MHFLAVKNEMRSLLLCRLCGRPPPSRSLSRRAPPPAVHYRFPLFVHRLRPFVSSDTPYSTATRMTEHCARRPYTVFVEGNVGSGKTTFLEQFTDCPNVCLAKEPVHKWQDVRGHNFLVSVLGDQQSPGTRNHPPVVTGPDVRGPETLELRVPVDRATDHVGTAPEETGRGPKHQNHGTVHLQRQVR